MQNELNTARLAHSAARRELNAHPIGARPDLVDAERAAWARVQSALAAVAAQPIKVPCRHKHCCEKAEHVAGTWYQHETTCPIHDVRTVGTID